MHYLYRVDDWGKGEEEKGGAIIYMRKYEYTSTIVYIRIFRDGATF